MGKFCVIGGQYCMINYGEADTLLGAKRLASKHEEYWDNWQGWHKPSVYRIEDCHYAKTFYGYQLIPNDVVCPVCVWNGKRWVEG